MVWLIATLNKDKTNVRYGILSLQSQLLTMKQRLERLANLFVLLTLCFKALIAKPQ